MDRPIRKRMRWSAVPEMEAEAEIIAVEKKVSKAGNQMVVLTFAVNHGGKVFKIYDYFTAKMQWKVEALAKSLNREGDLANGNFKLGTLVGTFVRVGISCTDDPVYGWSNKIEAYLGPADFKPPAIYGRDTQEADQTATAEDENLPF